MTTNGHDHTTELLQDQIDSLKFRVEEASRLAERVYDALADQYAALDQVRRDVSQIKSALLVLPSLKKMIGDLYSRSLILPDDD